MTPEAAPRARPPRLLPPYVVLDITDGSGSFCGRLLGDMGADVIKIEPPGGDPARAGPPVYEGGAGSRSLTWAFNNANKKGMTLAIESAEGRELFRRLTRLADVIVESFSPRHLDSLGLGYDSLRVVNPRLVLTSITPFGQDGPYSSFKGSDIVAMAMSGVMYLTGDPDRPPVRVGSPQACYHAGVHAAIGTLLALRQRSRTGAGQHVDVSTQQSVLLANMNALRFAEINGINVTRAGDYTFRPFTGASHRHTWPCKDGHVCYAIIAGEAGAHFQKALVDWMDGEGMAPDHLKHTDWASLDFAHLFQEDLERISQPILAFFKTKTKAELMSGAVAKGLPLFSQAGPKELLESEQLAARGYWVGIPCGDTTYTYPGPWVLASQAPLDTYGSPPEIGAHNQEVYGRRLGLSDHQIAALSRSGVI